MSHYFSKSCLKANRGWTDRAIEMFLGACDMREPNPFYTNGSPVQFFDAERVIRAEDTEEFKRFKEARTRRSKVAKGTL